MWKVLLLCLSLATPTIAAESNRLNASGVNFVGTVTEDTIQAFFELAISEYGYSNFGFSRDLFSSIVQKTSNKPAAYFYLGKIYEEVTQFKNAEMARQNYLAAATSKKLADHMRQASYLALIRLTDNADLAIKYAKESVKIVESPESNQALIMAYHKQFDKTGDEALLTKVEQVSRKMNAKVFDFQDIINQTTTNNTQQVNLSK